MLNTLKSWLFLMILSLSLPAVGVLTGYWISQSYAEKYEGIIVKNILQDRGATTLDNPDLLAKIKLDKICKESNLDEDGLGSVCNEYHYMKYLEYGSGITIIFSLIALLLIPSLSFCARQNRRALFHLFKPGLLITQFISAILVISNSAIVVFSIYFAEAFYLERVYFIVIGILALAALYTTFQVCIVACSPVRIAESPILGKILPKMDYPHIWEFVAFIAARIGTPAPDTIIVGLTPNFFVTEAKIICLDGEVTGKTLYLSLPFCRTLTKAELTAIIGHELGHFIGEDTLWSKKFYPIYRGAFETLHTLYANSNAKTRSLSKILIKLAFMPALYFMNFFLHSFEKAEKVIGRERELKADNVGVKITSPEVMATVLLKTHIYPSAWQFAQQKMVEELSQGKHITNMSLLFSNICKAMPADFMKDEVGVSHTSHPTDTHPTLTTRLNAIGIQLSYLYDQGIKLPTSDIAIELIHHADKIEEELSEVEQHSLVNNGAISITPKESQPDENVNQDAVNC